MWGGKGTGGKVLVCEAGKGTGVGGKEGYWCVGQGGVLLCCPLTPHPPFPLAVRYACIIMYLCMFAA